MISVVVCTHNRSTKLAAALGALVAQDVPDGGMEIVVVDNASTDETKRVVSSFASRVPFLHSIEETRLGLSHARNAGIDKAVGDIICFADDDAVAESSWLVAISRAMQRPEFCGGGGRIVPLWPREIPKWFVRGGPFKMHGGGSVVSLDLGDRTRAFRENELLPMGANMWYRREVFEAGVRFRIERGMSGRDLVYGDDFDVARQAMRRVGPLLYEPSAVVYHPVYPERLSKRYLREAYYSLGKFYGTFDESRSLRSSAAGLCLNALRLVCSGLFSPEARLYYELEARFELGSLVEQLGRRLGNP